MIRFYGWALFAPRPNPKLEDHPMSDVRNCLFSIFSATLYIGGRSSIRNPRTHHAVVTGPHLSWLLTHNTVLILDDDKVLISSRDIVFMYAVHPTASPVVY